MSHLQRRAAPKPADEFHAYIRALQTRATDISQSLAKMQLREKSPNWPRVLSQFAVLCGQLQTLYDELLTSERCWSSRLHSSTTLCQPISHLYNPATTLRIKPTSEAEEFETNAFQAFIDDADLTQYSAVELRDQLNDFNAAVLKLSRWSTQAASLPLPKDPIPVTGTHLPHRSKADTDRIEEAMLQQTMASMMTGRQTRGQQPTGGETTQKL